MWKIGGDCRAFAFLTCGIVAFVACWVPGCRGLGLRFIGTMRCIIDDLWRALSGVVVFFPGEFGGFDASIRCC